MPRKFLPASIAALIVAACAQELSVHVRGGDRPPNPNFLMLDTGVDVDEFQIVLRNLRLQAYPTDGGVDLEGVAHIGPEAYLIDLPGSSLTGGVFTPLLSDQGLGAKGFYEMDIDLAPVSDGDVQTKPGLAPLLGKTFVIKGRNQQGVPFTFESSMRQVLVRPSVYRLGLNNNNLDVNIAPNTWFQNPDGGTPIDPATIDPALRAIIESNVAASIDAYEDDNMDGIPDPLG